MEIKTINMSNIEKLYEGFNIDTGNGKPMSFGIDIFSFLEHCSISITLDGITLMELFFLKQIASEILPNTFDYTNENFKKDEKVLPYIDNLLAIHKEMQDDTDLSNVHPKALDAILPSGCFKFGLTAVFKGRNITSITGSNVINIFLDEGRFPETYPGNTKVKNNIGYYFYNNFYKYIASINTNFDLISDYMIHNTYYQYLDSGCNLAHISSPYGGVSFFGNDALGLKLQMKEIQSSIKENKDVYGFRGIDLHLVANTDIQTFFEISMNIPNIITDHENFNIVIAKNDHIMIEELIAKKYIVRLNELFEKVNECKERIRNPKGDKSKELGKAKSFDINVYNYIIAGSPIKYSMRIPLDNIPHFESYIKTSQRAILKEGVNTAVKAARSIFFHPNSSSSTAPDGAPNGR